MNILASNYDIVFLVIIAISTILALFRGAISEILSISVWLLAFLAMQRYGIYIDKYLPGSITNLLIRSFLNFLIFFILLAILFAILKKILAKIITTIGIGGLDYLLGALFGIFRGILICSILIVIMQMFKIDSTNSWQKSKFAPILTPTVKWIIQAMPKSFDKLTPPPKIFT
ncbi:MAG: hypothetical protein RL017_152 [Pseudomonadota bacterium]|jgi:membrane protein required for colicin V production|nr:CvpA family protein [Burkholderiales bacterium]